MSEPETPTTDFSHMLTALYVIVGISAVLLCLTLMTLAELRSAKHRLKLRYSKMLPTPYQDTDNQAVFEMYLIVASELMLIAYIILVI